MGLLSDTEGSSGSIYLVYKHSEKNFWLGKEDLCEFAGLIVDVDSVKTGWGIYTEAEGYQYQWDEKPGIRLPKPADIGDKYWTSAFSVQCYLKDTEQTVLWQSNTVGNARGFDGLTDCYLSHLNDKKPGQVGCFKSVKDDRGLLKVAYKDDKKQTSWPLFEWAGWIDRPEKFVDLEVMPVNEPVEEITEDQIPF